MKKKSKTIIVRGHIIDSLSLSKIFDEIIDRGGDYLLEDIEIGKTRTDLSRALIKISAHSSEILDSILARLHQLGAEEPEEPPVRLEPAPADGVFPNDFYVTSNFDTEIRHNSKWIRVKHTGMDCGIQVDTDRSSAKCVKINDVKKGEYYVVGLTGVKIRYVEKPGRAGEFAFMDSGVSSERPKRAMITETAMIMKRVRAKKGGKIIVVSGPAVVHTGARSWLAGLISKGYVDLLLTGNALAVHDIEASLFGTSLGVSLKEGIGTFEGHRNHMRAINRIRAAGGIRAAVEQGMLKDGIMHACIKTNCGFILAGSIRDDGPLPEVVTDTIKAQNAMRAGLRDAGMVIILATMLHGIAVGNLLPQRVPTVCVDISPAVVTKLADRGSHQARGLVMDVEAFLHELVEALEEN